MFAGRYFAERYFAPRYFPAGGEGEPEVSATNFSGGISAAISARRLRMLQIQQGLRKDDDEILTLILGTLRRRKR